LYFGINAMTAQQNKITFLHAISWHYPDLYQAAREAMLSRASGMSGLGEDASVVPQVSFTDTLNTLVSTIRDLAPIYIATEQARQCVEVNAQRAVNGIAPLDCAASGLSPQVSVGISPDLVGMGYIALGILGLALLSKRGRK
jgi:hypothetical protein